MTPADEKSFVLRKWIFAGLMVAANHPDWRAALKLDATSRVLLFGSEGDTDPDLYAKIVGRAGDAVRKGE